MDIKNVMVGDIDALKDRLYELRADIKIFKDVYWANLQTCQSNIKIKKIKQNIKSTFKEYYKICDKLIAQGDYTAMACKAAAVFWDPHTKDRDLTAYLIASDLYKKYNQIEGYLYLKEEIEYQLINKLTYPDYYTARDILIIVCQFGFYYNALLIYDLDMLYAKDVSNKFIWLESYIEYCISKKQIDATRPELMFILSESYFSVLGMEDYKNAYYWYLIGKALTGKLGNEFLSITTFDFSQIERKLTNDEVNEVKARVKRILSQFHSIDFIDVENPEMNNDHTSVNETDAIDKSFLGDSDSDVNSVIDNDSIQDAKTQFELGEAYIFGKDGIEINFVTAFSWFKKSAEQKYPPALYRMGTCYQDGVGVDKDDVEACHWYREAAKYGHAESMYMLVLNYLTDEMGYFYDDYEEEALKWLRLARNQGHKEATKWINQIEKEDKERTKNKRIYKSPKKNKDADENKDIQTDNIVLTFTKLKFEIESKQPTKKNGELEKEVVKVIGICNGSDTIIYDATDNRTTKIKIQKVPYITKVHRKILATLLEAFDKDESISQSKLTRLDTDARCKINKLFREGLKLNVNLIEYDGSINSKTTDFPPFEIVYYSNL